MSAANSAEILCEFPTFRAYKDGRIERLDQDYVPPSVDPATGVQSKDVEISSEINLSARLYLPASASPTQKLPILVYFHGGAFVVRSAFCTFYHKHLNYLVAEANVVAVSVNHRLAPEYPLPIAFEDSWLALKWIASQSTGEGCEDWIKDYSDFNRVYLCGDSSGANISHKLAMQIGSEKLEGITLCGIILNCPYFAGEDPIGSEASHPMRSSTNRLWGFACPSISGLDEPWINPAKDERISSLGCKKVLIYVAEKDYLKDRGWYYKEILRKSGWGGEVECVEVPGENHVFSVSSPDGVNGAAMLQKVASLINH